MKKDANRNKAILILQRKVKHGILLRPFAHLEGDGHHAYRDYSRNLSGARM